jgi:hypothetical protein
MFWLMFGFIILTVWALLSVVGGERQRLLQAMRVRVAAQISTAGAPADGTSAAAPVATASTARKSPKVSAPSAPRPKSPARPAARPASTGKAASLVKSASH